jgi:peptidoglycan/LPS O-acetylase OafA/YrhL
MSRTVLASPAQASAQATPTGRLHSLDGLRGLAAVVVLLHHALLTVPALARPYFVTEPVDRSDRIAWALTHTPLHLFWAGTEAVYVFFVLSGLVLALPVLRSTSFSWLDYYPRRAARLYLPVAGAVVWGLLLLALVHRTNDPDYSRWMVARPNAASWTGVFHDLTLLRGTSGVVSPLWSLQWEVWFSLLLPLYILGALLARRLPLWVPTAGLMAMVMAGVLVHSSAMTYLPIFGLGVLVATHLPELTRRAAGIRARGWVVLGVGATVLVTAHWWMLALTTSSSAIDVTTPLAVLGAAGYVLMGALCPQARRILETRPVQWLGAISFSLYLVHEPIVSATGFLLGPGSGLLVVVLAIPTSLLAGWLFYRGVEQPAHRASRRFGRWFVHTLRGAAIQPHAQRDSSP